MRVELFEIKRCCCCFPLRYGLLVVGYLKLIVGVLIFGNLISQTVLFAKYIKEHGMRLPADNYSIAMLALLYIFLLADIALTILYLVGCHNKSPKLLRVYNYYAIGYLALFALGYIIFHIVEMNSLLWRFGIYYSAYILRSSFVLGFTDICFQVYIILMNQSEIAKLETNCNFRFRNHCSNEAQCTLVEEETNGTYLQNTEPVEEDIVLNEDAGNSQAEKKQNGKYVRLDKQ